jgi:hypothetical protein
MHFFVSSERHPSSAPCAASGRAGMTEPNEPATGTNITAIAQNSPDTACIVFLERRNESNIFLLPEIVVTSCHISP